MDILEFLEYKKSILPSKVHSDNNLVELETVAIKDDDQGVLLEGGLTKSASTKFNGSSIKTNLIRFLTMEDSFVLENRLTLRTIITIGSFPFTVYPPPYRVDDAIS